MLHLEEDQIARIKEFYDTRTYFHQLFYPDAPSQDDGVKGGVRSGEKAMGPIVEFCYSGGKLFL